MSDHSVTRLLAAVQEGDDQATTDLWHRYYQQLVNLATQKLRGVPKRVADEDDVAAQAFATFCRRAADGQFPNLQDRTDLWRLLLVIAERKALNQKKHVFRLKNQAFHESALGDPDQATLDMLGGDSPTPEFAAIVSEEIAALLDSLADDTQRKVCVNKMEGYSNQEIADRLGCSLSTVERNLRRIRTHLWDPGSDD